MSYVIGVDVGGTNTDVAIIDGSTVVGWNKYTTTSNIIDGVTTSILQAFEKAEKNGFNNIRREIGRINIGTTHFINAVIKRTGLTKVACLRLCGAPSQSLPPFSDFPKDLKGKIDGGYYLSSGGFEYDGRPITEIKEEEIVKIIKELEEEGIRNIAVCGVFSPVDNTQELFVESLLKQHAHSDITWTLSSQLGYLGMLERENATILNESLKTLCRKTISGFRKSLREMGLECPVFFTQNDGTLISEEQTLKFPVYTFSSGATNSMRGAVHLSNIKDAIVVDIGGTSTDVGVLVNGFPREASTRVKVAGVNTNFRMPDTKSIGVGGGSFVRENQENQSITVGPGSVEYKLHEEALVFGGNTMVASDIAVAAGYAELGDKSRVLHLTPDFVAKTLHVIKESIEEAVNSVKLSKESYPVVLVGGGSVLVDENKPFIGASKIIKPNFYQVANAVGAALSQVSGSFDKLIEITTEHSRTVVIETAKQHAIDQAVRNGAIRETCSILDIVEVHMSYVAVPRKRLKVKAVGDLNQHKSTGDIVKEKFDLQTDSSDTAHQKKNNDVYAKNENRVKHEPTPKEEGVQSLSNHVEDISTYAPIVNSKGEWELSKFDVECLTLGAGVLGCGGGGSPYLGRLELLACMEEGYQPKIINPKSFKNGLAYGMAYMGAPEILYERLANNEQLPLVLQVAQQLTDLGFRPGQNLQEIKDIASENHITVEGDSEKYLVIDYKAKPFETKPAAILVLEIGGMNSLCPLTVGARLDVPIIDCDGMGRAFPKLQHYLPFIYGSPAYPAVLADNKGKTVCCVRAESATELENFFRTECVKSGCAAVISMPCYGVDDINSKMCGNTLTQAWQIGLTILKARRFHTNIIHAILKECNGVYFGMGKICDLEKKTMDGFTKGKIFIEGTGISNGVTIVVDFQNEYLIAKKVLQGNASEESLSASDSTKDELSENDSGGLLASTPDLITLVETDTGEPIQSSELKYGIRVSVLVLPAHPLMRTAQALKYVGPNAFGYEGVEYEAVADYRDVHSNALVR